MNNNPEGELADRPQTYINDMHLSIMGRPSGSNEPWREMKSKGGEITLLPGYQFAVEQKVDSDAELKILLDKVQSITAFKITGLILGGSWISDAGLVHLKNLNRITHLNLGG